MFTFGDKKNSHGGLKAVTIGLLRDRLLSKLLIFLHNNDPQFKSYI